MTDVLSTDTPITTVSGPVRPDSPALSPREESLGRQIRRGLGWSFGNMVAARAVTLVSGVVLARILAPRDFGVFAIALVATDLLMSINDAGLIAAIVRLPGDVRRPAQTAFTLTLGGSVALYALIFLAAPLFAAAVHASDATGVIRLLTLAIVIDGFSAVPSGLLTRAMRQDLRAIGDVAGLIVLVIVSIALAVMGFGAWSLAWGRLIGNGTAAILFILLSPARVWPGFDRFEARRLVGFGLPMAGASLITFGLLNFHYVVVGSLLGPVALGFYVLAWNLSSWPVNLLSQTAQRVTLAGFARLLSDREALDRNFTRAFLLLMAATIPICLVLALLAYPLITKLYGPRWGGSVDALRFLAVLAGVRVAANLIQDLLAALGRSRTVFGLQAIWAVAVIPALIVGARLDGIRGASVGQALVAAAALPLFLLAVQRSGVGVRNLLTRLPWLAIAALGAALAGVLLLRLVRGDWARLLFIAPLVTVMFALAAIAAPGLRSVLHPRAWMVEHEAATGSRAGRQLAEAIDGILAVVARLFPVSPRPNLSPRSVLLALLTLAVGTTLQLVRQTGRGALDTLYAEDGREFMAEALRSSPLHAFTVPYMGYLHSVPRLLAEGVALLPLPWAGAAFSIAAATVITGLALLVFRAAAAHFQHTLTRALLAVSLVLLPVAKDEVLNNVANLHWFLIFASFWVLLWRTERAWELGLGGGLLVLAGLSDPLTMLLAPVVVLRAIALRGWRNHVFTGAWAASLALQVSGIVVSHAHRHLPYTTNLVKLAGWYVSDVLGGALYGTRLLGGHRSTVGLALTAIGVVALVALALMALRDGRLRQRPLPVLAVFMSGVLFVVPVGLTGVDAPRYSVAPVLLLLTAVASVLDGVRPVFAPPAWRGARVVALSLLALVWLADFQLYNGRSQGPAWSAQLQQAETNCATSHAATVYVPIAPSGWQAEIPCRRLPLVGASQSEVSARATPGLSADWPGPFNTGVPAGTKLAPSGTIVVTTPGAVLDGLDVNGCISVRASNVIVKRSRVHGGYCGSNVIQVVEGVSGVRLVDVEVDGQDLKTGYAGISGGGGFECLRCNVHHVGDGFNAWGASPIVIQDSWVHELYIRDDLGTHNQDVITVGFTAGLTIRHNNLENWGGQTSTISLFPDQAPINSVTIDRNLLNGGGYTVYAGPSDQRYDSISWSRILVTNNHFGRKFFPKGGYWGPVASCVTRAANGSDWSGNVWADTRQPVDC